MVHQSRARIQLLRRTSSLDHRLHLVLQVMALVHHVSDVGGDIVLPFIHANLVKNAKHLVGIDRPQSQIIVCVPPIIEVKSPDHLVVKQPGNNLLDILSLIVMPGIDKHERLRSSMFGKQVGHSPIRDVGMVEGRLERFVLDQQTLPGLERGMNFLQTFLEKSQSFANVLGPRIV